MRDPYFIEDIPADQKHNFISEGPVSAERLTKLKADIEESELPNQAYPRPANVSEMVLEVRSLCFINKLILAGKFKKNALMIGFF